MMTDCLFCKIVRGEIPCHKVYEDTITLVFLDINPTSPGHLLIIPKHHVTRFKDLTKEEMSDMFGVMQVILNKVETKISKAYNIGINQGKEAGQVVDHLHIHIIPRYGQDNLQPWPHSKLKDSDAKEILDRLR